MLAVAVVGQRCSYIETSQLICFANQLTGFYMIKTLAFNEFNTPIYLQNIHYLYVVYESLNCVHTVCH